MALEITVDLSQDRLEERNRVLLLARQLEGIADRLREAKMEADQLYDKLTRDARAPGELLSIMSRVKSGLRSELVQAMRAQRSGEQWFHSLDDLR